MYHNSIKLFKLTNDTLTFNKYLGMYLNINDVIFPQIRFQSSYLILNDTYRNLKHKIENTNLPAMDT